MHHKKVFIIAGLVTQSSKGASECKLPSRGNMGKGSCMYVCCWLGLYGRLVAYGQPRRATSSTRVTLEQPREGTVALSSTLQRLCTGDMQPACPKEHVPAAATPN